MSLCSTDYLPWPSSTFLHHCYKQSWVIHATQMYHRCTFAQGSCHPRELSCNCCLFTQLGAGYKFDLQLLELDAFRSLQTVSFINQMFSLTHHHRGKCDNAFFFVKSFWLPFMKTLFFIVDILLHTLSNPSGISMKHDWPMTTWARSVRILEYYSFFFDTFKILHYSKLR